MRQYDRFWQVVRHVQGDSEQLYQGRIPNDYLPRMFLELHPVLYPLTAITVFFGGIHLIAWNFEFPTPAEKIFWRTAGLVSVSLPLIALLVVPVCAALHKRLVGLNTYNFIAACLVAIREYAWEAPDKKELYRLREELENAYDNTEMIKTEHYKKIFNRQKDHECLERLRDFICKRKHLFPLEFPGQFEQLLGIIRDDTYPEDADRLDLYPQLRLRWPTIILSITGIVYCIARFSTIVLAFSSLRSMPASVYVTTWAKSIPDIQ